MLNAKMKESGGYLPPSFAETCEWKTRTFQRNGVTLDIAVPVLREEQINALAAVIKRSSRDVLKSYTVNQIIELMDQATARFLDRGSPYRQKAEKLLPIITGYHEEIIRLGLTSYLKTFRKHELQRFLTEDFGNPTLLDTFQPRPKGGFSKAIGPDLILHVWAGNVPALPLWSLISGLMVKAGSVGKVSSSEPLFAGLFVQALVEIEPRLADCLAIVWWKGGDEQMESCYLQQADVVVGYGGNAALDSLRSRIPVPTRFLAFGHKMSFGLISAACLDSRKAWQTAHDAALDVARYDQQGCYSPHFFFVQKGGSVSPRAFARYIAHELDSLEKRYPRRDLSMEEAAVNAAWKNEEEMRMIREPENEILGTANQNWTVVYEENHTEIRPSCLDRVVKIIAVDYPEQAVEAIEPYRSLLQTVGLAATPEELFKIAHLLGTAGVTRITALGRMTSPEAAWHHDGRFNLLDLVQMVDIEYTAEAYAEKFASYVD